MNKPRNFRNESRVRLKPELFVKKCDECTFDFADGKFDYE